MPRLYRLLALPPLTWVLLLLPIAGFFMYFFTLRYNVPWLDDYENIPYFLDRFLTAPTFGGKMTALLRPNNEHRVVYARLVVLGQYFLTGKLNFANLMLWGNLGLVLIFVLLYRALHWHERVSARALVGLLPVPLLLFTAQSYIMTFTAIFSLQYLAIITLVLLTLFVLVTDRPLHLGLALGLGLLSTFSMGNGLLLWPAGAGMLFVQRRWLALGIWLGVGALGVYLYFRGYPVQQGNAEGFAYVMNHPLETLAGFLVYAGSVFDLFPALPQRFRYYLPFAAGLIVVTGLAYWLIQTLISAVKNARSRQPVSPSRFEAFVFGCLLFLLANIALIAFFRLRFDFGMSLTISYRIYSLTLWSVASVLLFSRLPERMRVRVWPAVWGLFVVVNVLSYATYLPVIFEYHKHKQGLTFSQIHNDIGLGGSRNSNLARFISDLTTLMDKRGWYRLPNPAITPDEQQLMAPVSTVTGTAPLRVDYRPEFIVVTSDEPGYAVGLNEGAYVVMKSARHTYLVFANRNRPLTFRPWRVLPGFSAAMPIALMQQGRYRLGLFRTHPDRSVIEFTNQFVDVP
ncbi:hypothetical protein [Spirosoma arcticum]